MERWRGQHNDKQSGQRQRKNPLQKFKKLQSWGARQIINIQLSKLRFEAIFNVFVSRLVLVYRKGNFALNIMYGKFWLHRTSLFEIWAPAWSSVSTNRFHKRIVFFTWQSATLSFLWACLFFLFFSQGLSSAVDFFHAQRFFHKQRASTCEFCKVCDVNKIWK